MVPTRQRVARASLIVSSFFVPPANPIVSLLLLHLSRSFPTSPHWLGSRQSIRFLKLTIPSRQAHLLEQRRPVQNPQPVSTCQQPFPLPSKKHTRTRVKTPNRSWYAALSSRAVVRPLDPEPPAEEPASSAPSRLADLVRSSHHSSLHHSPIPAVTYSTCIEAGGVPCPEPARTSGDPTSIRSDQSSSGGGSGVSAEPATERLPLRRPQVKRT